MIYKDAYIIIPQYKYSNGTIDAEVVEVNKPEKGMIFHGKSIEYIESYLDDEISERILEKQTRESI